jgi:hypothetical protein
MKKFLFIFLLLGFSAASCFARYPDINKKNNTQFKAVKKGKPLNTLRHKKTKREFLRVAAERDYKGIPYKKVRKSKRSNGELVLQCPAMGGRGY